MVIRKILVASIAACSAAALGVALAQTTTDQDAHTARAEKKADKMAKEKREEHEKAWKAADKNNDGGLSKDEMKAAGTKKFPTAWKYFDEMDANHDGKVTLAERDAWHKAHPNKK